MRESRSSRLAIAEKTKPLALPAPESMAEYEMTPEELIAFAIELAEELADAAICRGRGHG